MNFCKYKSLFSLFIMVLFAGMLSSCEMFAPEPDSRSKKVKPAPVQYTARDYVKHLTLARVSLEKHHDSLQVINKYMVTRHKRLEHQALLVLEYKAKDSSVLYKLAAPIYHDRKDAEFSDLHDIMEQLKDTPYILQNLEVSVAKVLPHKDLSLEKESDTAIKALLDMQEERLIQNTVALPLMENVRVELRLLRFFIKHRFRDAAYITADNAKRSLAKLTEKDNTAATQQLLQQLEQLELEMRNAMPFSI